MIDTALPLLSAERPGTWQVILQIGPARERWLYDSIRHVTGDFTDWPRHVHYLDTNIEAILLDMYIDFIELVGI